MEYEIRYESTGEISNRNEMVGYQYYGDRKQANNFRGELEGPYTFPESHIESCHRGLSQRKFYQPSHVNQQTANGVSRCCPHFKEGTNYLNVAGRNMAYNQIRSNCQNSRPGWLYRHSHLPNSDVGCLMQNGFYNRDSRFHHYNSLSMTEPSITRCCCCGRNRIYQQDLNSHPENTYYNQNMMKSTSNQIVNRQVVGQPNFIPPRQCVVETDYLKEHRIVHYNRREVVTSNSAMSLCRVREIAQERIYTQFNDKGNNSSEQSPSTVDPKMYQPFEEPVNVVGNNPINDISVYQNIKEENNNVDFCDSQSTLLTEKTLNSSNISSQNSIDPFDEIYSTIDGEEDDESLFFKNYQDSVLASLIKESDKEREEDSLVSRESRINTQELCRFVSDELKKYSVSQSTFAKKVLNRSQGTLSDILRKPKPWNKLRTGKDTFVKMYKWSLLPENERLFILKEGGSFKTLKKSTKSKTVKSKKD